MTNPASAPPEIGSATPDDRRRDFLAWALASAPYDARTIDIWLFAYGSMLDAPPFRAVDQETVTCAGWRRSFCLTDPIRHGIPAAPGLAMGLIPGGQCTGIAWRISAQTLREDLERVWTTEMSQSAYLPSWQVVRSPRGSTPALTLLADTASPLFEGDLSNEAVVQRLATCAGPMGSNGDELRSIVERLDALGAPDLELVRLLRDVRKAERSTCADRLPRRPAEGRTHS